MSAGWSRRVGAGYEVSSKGDKRFSALYARLADGRTIEDAWAQAKGYPDRYAAKGRPAKDPDFDYQGVYRGLWFQWANENPALMADLAVKSAGVPLVDRFAKTDNNQAWALSELLAERNWAEAVSAEASKGLQLSSPPPLMASEGRMAGDALALIAAAGGGVLLTAAAVVALKEEQERKALEAQMFTGY